ncbi:hypothetical protein NDU88_004899 [Pleurodeles waltl]|uniref:Uncharacterized protein n=1 Tax=Pleurodeles waltl TaxID=8319 RepID=A0AAV7QD83_PLEWA|nr:hypothetical protein NDU88_004899 [Pleurodeles waltl]
MLWDCVPLLPCWTQINKALNELTNNNRLHTWECCLPGLFPKPKVVTGFVDLTLILAKVPYNQTLEITSGAIGIVVAGGEVSGSVESAAVRREEYGELRKKPIARQWEAFKHHRDIWTHLKLLRLHNALNTT